MESHVNQLKQAIESQHGGNASFVEVVPISEYFEDKKAWEGAVHIFSLAGHPKAKIAYAWSAAIDGSTKRRYYAVLGVSPVNSAQDAVRAAIVAEHSQKAG